MLPIKYLLISFLVELIGFAVIYACHSPHCIRMKTPHVCLSILIAGVSIYLTWSFHLWLAPLLLENCFGDVISNIVGGLIAAVISWLIIFMSEEVFEF